MEKETLKNIFNFIEENDNRNVPFIWKLLNNQPFTEKDDLNVKGNLYLGFSTIESLPEVLTIEGNLDLDKSAIKSVPKGLKVGGHLGLRKTKITSLPEGLEVGSYLDIEHTKITSLPKGLQVGSSLYIGETPLKKYSDDELREMVKPGFIKGEIWR
jgi:hypothetical protein